MAQHNLKEFPIRYLSSESVAVLWTYMKKYFNKSLEILPAATQLDATPDIKDKSKKIATTQFVAESLDKALDDFKVMQYKGTISSQEELEATIESVVGSTYIANGSFIYNYYDENDELISTQISAGDMFIKNTKGWDIITTNTYSDISSATVGEHVKDNIVTFYDSTGRLVQDSGVSINEFKNIDTRLLAVENDLDPTKNTSKVSIINSNINDITKSNGIIDSRLQKTAESLSEDIESLENSISSEQTSRISNILYLVKTLYGSSQTDINKLPSIDNDLGEIARAKSVEGQLSEKIEKEILKAREEENKIYKYLLGDDKSDSYDEDGGETDSSNVGVIEKLKKLIGKVSENISTETTNRKQKDESLDSNIEILQEDVEKINKTFESYKTIKDAAKEHNDIKSMILETINNLKSTSFEVIAAVNTTTNKIQKTVGGLETLPEDGVIYLVPSSESDGLSGSYIEYIKIGKDDNAKLERIGVIQSDLGNFYTKDEVEDKFSSLPIKMVSSLPDTGESNTLYILYNATTNTTAVYTWGLDDTVSPPSVGFVQLGAKDSELRETVDNLVSELGTIEPSEVGQTTIKNLIKNVNVSDIYEDDDTSPEGDYVFTEIASNLIIVGETDVTKLYTRTGTNGNYTYSNATTEKAVENTTYYKKSYIYTTSVKTVIGFSKALTSHEAWARNEADKKITSELNEKISKKVEIDDIVDNLVSSSATTKPLSARQGYVLSSSLDTLKETVDRKIESVGQPFKFRGTVDNTDLLPQKSNPDGANYLEDLSVGDVFQVKSSTFSYVDVTETLEIGESSDGLYVIEDVDSEPYIYIPSSGLIEMNVRYFKKVFNEPSDDTYETVSYAMTNVDDYSTGYWVTISVSISNIVEYFSTPDDAQNIIDVYEQLHS